MSIKFYQLSICSTCQKALKFLDTKKIKVQKIEITETPPTISELKKMIKHLEKQGGSFKNLFNTSGVQYRELKIADKLKNGLSEKEALEILSKNGKLVKRPFVLSEDVGVVGFKEELWKKLLL